MNTDKKMKKEKQVKWKTEQLYTEGFVPYTFQIWITNYKQISKNIEKTTIKHDVKLKWYKIDRKELNNLESIITQNTV